MNSHLAKQALLTAQRADELQAKDPELSRVDAVKLACHERRKKQGMSN